MQRQAARRCTIRRHVFTRAELFARGMTSAQLTAHLRAGTYHRVLPGVYCTRRPTTSDRCVAVSLWRPDAVLSHWTALWMHGLGEEPEIIEAYVRELPADPVPSWLWLRVPEWGIYDESGGFDPADVVR